MGCQSRHRWREVEMRTEVAKNGTTTITHALGKALPWSAWSRDRQGGLYVPTHVQVVVRAHTLRLAPSVHTCTPRSADTRRDFFASR